MSARKFAVILLLAGAAVLNSGVRAAAAAEVVFKDSWSDSVSNNLVATSGLFSTTISVPFNGALDAVDIDSNSVFSLSIGPGGATALIADGTFGDATAYSASGNSATFQLLDASTLVVAGTINVTWNSTSITASGTASADILGEELLLRAGSAHTAGTNDLSTAGANHFYEIVLTVDASDNGGGIFTYDNAYIQVTGSNKETEYASNSVSFPLESGSISGALVLTNSITVAVNPAKSGTVTGLHTGEKLQAGKAYKVTAAPTSKEWIFSDWTDGAGDVLAATPTFTYTNEAGGVTNFSELELVANFVTNAFYKSDLAGTYSGLFYVEGTLNPSNTGYITITVGPGGAYSGHLNLSTSPTGHPISGQLAVNGGVGTATSIITLSRSNNLAVYLQVATDTNLTDSGAGALSGYIVADYGTNSSAAPIYAQISAVNTNITPGVYNLVLTPAFDNPASGPGGYSYGTATVSKERKVTYVFNLSDGSSPVTTASSIYRNGESPIYASLYGGKGALLGFIDFSTTASNTILPNALTWTKRPVKDAYYTNGFTASAELAGALYVRPKAGTNAFDATDLTLVVDTNYYGFNLPDAFDIPITFNPVHNTFAGTNGAKITWSPSTGAISGTFVDKAVSKTPITFHGLVINGVAYGHYADSTLKETGPITLGAPGGTNGASF